MPMEVTLRCRSSFACRHGLSYRRTQSSQADSFKSEPQSEHLLAEHGARLARPLGQLVDGKRPTEYRVAEERPPYCPETPSTQNLQRSTDRLPPIRQLRSRAASALTAPVSVSVD
jgi:hypothetical protein